MESEQFGLPTGSNHEQIATDIERMLTILEWPFQRTGEDELAWMAFHTGTVADCTLTISVMSLHSMEIVKVETIFPAKVQEVCRPSCLPYLLDLNYRLALTQVSCIGTTIVIGASLPYRGLHAEQLQDALYDVVSTLEAYFPNLVLVATLTPEQLGGGSYASEASAEELVQEKSPTCDVILADFGPNKVQVLKVVRELTGLGLWEAKALVEAAPQPVMSAVPKAEAEAAVTKLQAAGAKVEMR